MTEKLIQEDLDSVSDLEDFMEDHNPQDLETTNEAENIITKFEKIVERYKRCHSELKIALGEGYEDKYSKGYRFAQILRRCATFARYARLL